MKKRANSTNNSKISFFNNSKNAIFALLLIAAAAAAYTLVNAAVVSHPPSAITPQGAGSGLDSDKLQAISLAEILAVGGGTAVPLQGVINYPPYTAPIITNVPLALPKAGCSVKVTSCVASGSPPTELRISTNTAQRITKTPNENSGTGYGCQEVQAWQYSNTAEPQKVGTRYRNVEGGSLFEGAYICSNGIRKAATPNQWSYPSGPDCSHPFCVVCPGTYPTWDYDVQVCYAQPRCPAAGAGETSIGLSTEASRICVYCPSSAPQYDPTTKNCFSSSGVSTTTQGLCSVFTSQLLSTGFTDITFRSGGAYHPVNYVTAAYSCPEGP